MARELCRGLVVLEVLAVLVDAEVSVAVRLAEYTEASPVVGQVDHLVPQLGRVAAVGLGREPELM